MADLPGRIPETQFPLETGIWIAGLVMVAIPDPAVETGWTLCLFDWTGFFEWFGMTCPGCGLGHAIGYLFRGEFALSFEHHPLAVPVVMVLSGRAFFLTIQQPCNPINGQSNKIRARAGW